MRLCRARISRLDSTLSPELRLRSVAASRQSRRQPAGVQALACLAPVPVIRQAKAWIQLPDRGVHEKLSMLRHEGLLPDTSFYRITSSAALASLIAAGCRRAACRGRRRHRRFAATVR